MISIKQLRYFAAAARFAHFGKAAAHCHITQPALSMQIRDLETRLGVRLFERGQQGVRLTAAGEDALDRARSILAMVRDLDDVAHRHGGLLSGRLRLGVIPTLAPYILPPLLPRLRANYQDLDLRIRETQTAQLVEELVEGELDALLLALPIEHRDVETLALFDDAFLLAAPAGWRPSRNPRGGRRQATPKRAVRVAASQLHKSALLLLEEGHCLRDQALAYCQLSQVGNLDTFGASSLSTIVQMVANSMGLTLLPEIALALETRHGDIEVMRFEPPEPKRSIGLAWRRSSSRVPDFAELGRLVMEAAPRADA